MHKIALMGQIHNDGLKILEDSKFNIIEITDYSFENFILDKISAAPSIILLSELEPIIMPTNFFDAIPFGYKLVFLILSIFPKLFVIE